MVKFAAVAALLSMAQPACAQMVRDKVTPLAGSLTVASVGDPVYQNEHYTSVPAYEVHESFVGKNILALIVFNPGDKFIPVSSKAKLKACKSASLELFHQAVYDACLYDDDLDGTFDRFGGNEMQGGKKFPHPIPYTKSEYVEPTRDAIKQVVTYLGATKDSLRLSYREFINDMARPAFTEEYTFPLSAAYPQPISFKGVHITVVGIDGSGIRYTVDSTPTS